MSFPTSPYAHLLTTTSAGTTIAFPRFIASIVTPDFLVSRVLYHYTTVLGKRDAVDNHDRDAVSAVTRILTSCGYLGIAVYYSWATFEAMMEGVLRATTLVTGASVGIAASAVLVIWTVRLLA